MEQDRETCSNVELLTTGYAPELVTNKNQVIQNIVRFNEEIITAPMDSILVSRLSQFISWYAIDQFGEDPLFGPSKFIGYVNMDCNKYENMSTECLHGSNTESRLKKWFLPVKVNDGSILGNIPILDLPIYISLKEFLNRFGKLPRKNARISMLKV
ncbi:MAG: hypothetical protein RIC87_08130 [Kiloniellales bacterium]